MTDPVDRPPILPDNATRREKAIADADAAIMDLNTDQITKVRDVPNTKPVYLPDLAWERSTDVWDPAWSDDIKRAVIEAAPEVHRHKGTVYAVKTALGALQVDANVVEWWQSTPKRGPYTFRVTAYARARLYDGPLLDARLIRVIFGSIMKAKPASRAFDLVVGAGFQSTLGLVPVFTARNKRQAAAEPRIDTSMATTLGLVPVAVGTTRVSVALVPALP